MIQIDDERAYFWRWVGSTTKLVVFTSLKRSQWVTKDTWKLQWLEDDSFLGGGFKHFYFYRYLGKILILTNIFQRGWNHQLDLPFGAKGLFSGAAAVRFQGV